MTATSHFAAQRPIFIAELAHALGCTPDHLRRNVTRLADAGMPAPLPLPGRKRWDRAQIAAWRAGHTLAAANDATPLVPDDAAWRDALAHEYGSPR